MYSIHHTIVCRTFPFGHCCTRLRQTRHARHRRLFSVLPCLAGPLHDRLTASIADCVLLQPTRHAVSGSGPGPAHATHDNVCIPASEAEFSSSCQRVGAVGEFRQPRTGRQAPKLAPKVEPAACTLATGWKVLGIIQPWSLDIVFDLGPRSFDGMLRCLPNDGCRGPPTCREIIVDSSETATAASAWLAFLSSKYAVFQLDCCHRNTAAYVSRCGSFRNHSCDC